MAASAGILPDDELSAMIARVTAQQAAALGASTSTGAGSPAVPPVSSLGHGGPAVDDDWWDSSDPSVGGAAGGTSQSGRDREPDLEFDGARIAGDRRWARTTVARVRALYASFAARAQMRPLTNPRNSHERDSIATCIDHLLGGRIEVVLELMVRRMVAVEHGDKNGDWWLSKVLDPYGDDIGSDDLWRDAVTFAHRRQQLEKKVSRGGHGGSGGRERSYGKSSRGASGSSGRSRGRGGRGGRGGARGGTTASH